MPSLCKPAVQDKESRSWRSLQAHPPQEVAHLVEGGLELSVPSVGQDSLLQGRYSSRPFALTTALRAFPQIRDCDFAGRPLHRVLPLSIQPHMPAGCISPSFAPASIAAPGDERICCSRLNCLLSASPCC